MLLMRRTILSLAPIGLCLAACGGGATAPLDPPRDSLSLAFRDPIVAGEMTWVEVSRPAADTGAVVLTSSDPSVLTVDADGQVFPFRAGTVTLAARSAQFTGQISVTLAPRSDAFEIALRFRWTPSPEELQLFARAALRWQRVLRQAATATTHFPANACLVGTAAETIVQQGVVVYLDRFDDAQVAPGVTGTAGPCVVDAEGRTRVGVVTIRQSFSAAAAGLSAAERAAWENQFVRQIGQTLGLSGLTVFGVPRPELDTVAAGGPQWTGAAAMAAYRAAGGAAGGVPITADFAFWRPGDPALSGEMLLPQVTAASRLSGVSLGALTDRGYLTVASRLEPVAGPSPTVAAALLGGLWREQLWVASGGQMARRVQ